MYAQDRFKVLLFRKSLLNSLLWKTGQFVWHITDHTSVKLSGTSYLSNTVVGFRVTFGLVAMYDLLGFRMSNRNEKCNYQFNN